MKRKIKQKENKAVRYIKRQHAQTKQDNTIKKNSTTQNKNEECDYTVRDGWRCQN